MKEKVLIIRFNSIGDLVLTTPVIDMLFNNGYEVHYLVKSSFANVLSHNKHISQIWTFDGDYHSTLNKLKSIDYRWVVDLHNNIRSNKFARALGKPTVQFKKNHIKDFLMTRFGFFKASKEHIVDRFLDTIEPVTRQTRNGRYPLYIYKEHFKDLDEGPFIAIGIGAAFETKQIPNEKIVAFINAFPNQKFILLGGPGDVKKSEVIVKEVSSNRITNFTGIININESAYCISNAQLLLTGDSGLMHIATALNVPVVAVYGSTHPLLGYTPYYNSEVKHYIIQNEALKCRPCTKQGRNTCPKKHFKCMNEIDTQSMIDAARSILTHPC